MTINEEIKAYKAKQSEDENVLLLCKSTNAAGYTVYGDKATVVAAMLGTPVAYRNYGEGVGMVISTSIPSSMLTTVNSRLGSMYPVQTFIPEAYEAPEEDDEYEDDEDYDEDEDEYDDDEYDEDEDEDYDDDEDEEDEEYDTLYAVNTDRVTMRMRGESCLVVKEYGIDIFDDEGNEVDECDIDPNGVYHILKSQWDEFAASENGKIYFYVLAQLEKATADILKRDYPDVSMARECVEVLMGDYEETLANAAKPEEVQFVPRGALVGLAKIFASRQPGSYQEGSAERSLAAAFLDIMGMIEDKRLPEAVTDVIDITRREMRIPV